MRRLGDRDNGCNPSKCGQWIYQRNDADGAEWGNLKSGSNPSAYPWGFVDIHRASAVN